MARLGMQLGLSLVAAVSVATVGAAQTRMVQQGTRLMESRAALDSQARVAEAARRPAEVAELRARLRDGDFQEGDRVVVVYQGADALIADTLTVRAGQRLSIPQHADIDLHGVLRSEVHQKIDTYLKQFYVAPQLRATPLIRVLVGGSVARPGAYYVAPEAPLTDAIMLAGGQAADAEPKKTTVRRAGIVVWEPRDLEQAITQGLSVDRLYMRQGDEVFIPRKVARNWLTVLQVTLGIVGLAFAIAR